VVGGIPYYCANGNIWTTFVYLSQKYTCLKAANKDRRKKIRFCNILKVEEKAAIIIRGVEKGEC